MGKVIKFESGHLSLMEPMEGDVISKQEAWEEKISQLADVGTAFTYVAEGRVVLCGGIVETDDGVAYCWLMPSTYINTYSHEASRKVKEVLEDLMVTRHLRRLESNCSLSEVHDKWMSFLGFKVEGIKKQAGFDKSDLKMWARVKEL